MILSVYFLYVQALNTFEPDWRCYPRLVYGSHYEARVEKIGGYNAMILEEKLDSIKIPVRIPHKVSVLINQ